MRRIGRRFLQHIDSETTELYQWMLYIVWCCAGLVYLSFSFGPPVSLQNSLTWVNYVAWSWMNVIGPAACLFGMILRRWTTAEYAGHLFYFAGNLILCTAAVAYISGAFKTWGTSAWGMVPTAIIAIAAAGLTLRAARQLLEVEAVKRHRK